MQRGAALMLLLLAGLQCAAGGSALGRDEKRAERITGDDDPGCFRSPLCRAPWTPAS